MALRFNSLQIGSPSATVYGRNAIPATGNTESHAVPKLSALIRSDGPRKNMRGL
jgi:hypothetical protein